MAVDIADLALQFIDDYGLYAIFILLIMDGALMLPVFPGELVMVMAVAAYATDPAELVFLILLTTVAGLLGSLLLYGITRGGGRRLVERFPRFFMMPRKRRERLERTFARPIGQSLVFFLRLVPLTRVLVNIPAGLAKMPIVRFLVLSTVGLLAYHAGFLWFTYEVRREGSALATQKEELEAAYASPAMQFVEANAIITGLALLAIGAVISVRASRQMVHDPEESAGSLIGTLATATLFWGGIALAVFTYMDPDAVYTFTALGGVDVESLASDMGYGPVPFLFGVAGLAIAIGFTLGQLQRIGKAHRRSHKVMKKYLAGKQQDARIVAAVTGRPAPTPATDPAHRTSRAEDEAYAAPRRGGHVPTEEADGAPAKDAQGTPAGPRWEVETTLHTRSAPEDGRQHGTGDAPPARWPTEPWDEEE